MQYLPKVFALAAAVAVGFAAPDTREDEGQRRYVNGDEPHERRIVAVVLQATRDAAKHLREGRHARGDAVESASTDNGGPSSRRTRRKAAS